MSWPHQRESPSDRIDAMIYIAFFAAAVGILAAAALLLFAYMTGHLKPAYFYQFVGCEAALIIIATMLFWCVKFLLNARPTNKDL